MSSEPKLATMDSADYGHQFYGILNAHGQFWTPLVFDNAEAARDHIRAYWNESAARDLCLRTHRIVPVRIQLEELSQ